MNKAIKYLTLAMIPLAVASCRKNDPPVDLAEHDEVEQVTFTVTDLAAPATSQKITVINNAPDKILTLTKDHKYSVVLELYTRNASNQLTPMTGEITTEKDDHFFKYSFAPSGVAVLRAADDVVRTDGNKLGLHTVWTATATTPTTITAGVILAHKATTVNQNWPSVDNQLGTTTGGEEDVNINSLKISVQ